MPPLDPLPSKTSSNTWPGGMTPDEILADFPYLTREDIPACLAYAAAREQGG